MGVRAPVEGLATRSIFCWWTPHYRLSSTLDVAGELVQFVATLLLAERRRRRTRGSGALSCFCAAVLGGCAWSATARPPSRWPAATSCPRSPPDATSAS